LADFDLIEHLQRRLPGLTAPLRVSYAHASPAPAANPNGRDDPFAGGRPNRRNNAAISRAAAAASRPLLPASLPARARACSSVSVVRTPNAIGTPVSPAAAITPWAAEDAMYSKCGVSP